jgi:hypothetical protein
MNCRRETAKMGVPPGNRPAVPRDWFRGVPERYVAGAYTRGRQEGRPYPWSQQVIHEISGLTERGWTMADENTCSRCGGSKLESGRVQSTGRIHFHFENPRFLTMHTGYVPIVSTMCLDCGKIDLAGEVTKARRLSKKEQSS